ncbi:hypothetical protein DBR06_SOUSAS50210002, partial [Sousa chinensis]
PSTPEGPQGTTKANAAVSCTNSDEGTNSQKKESSKSSKGIEDLRRDPLHMKVALLVHYLLHKYQKKEPITKSEMLKFVIKKYKYRFNEILKRASEHMELAFGLDLKEVDPTRHCYALVSKLDLTSNGTMNEEENPPKTGLLMIVLGVIFINSNCATEEEIWEVLNMMGVHAERKHFIYGDPKKVITEDLVQLKYLEYRQVANSDPPRYEFLWGPRAHVETSKMKVLEFLAKIYDTVPSAFPFWYEEALRDEEERAQARMAARAPPSIRSSRRDPLTRKVRKLVQFLLEKYKTKEPILQAALLKAVNRKYEKHFPEILSRASEIMQVVFGLELKEVDPSSHSYAFISNVALPSEGSTSDESGLPMSGLLMILLGLIFKKGNRATEEEIWEFLSELAFYAGMRHLISGEPRRLISKDFVQQKYLTYRQVPNSDPPRYEFLWGPRAHAETSKMKVLEFVAKIIGTVPSALPDLYEEALKDEEERAAARAAAVAEGRPL